MTLPDFDALTEDEAFLSNLGRGVWLMDNHRWALKVWDTERRHPRYTLVHADYHWDGCYDFQPGEEAALVTATSEELAALVAEGKRIRYDSFIAPAVKRGLIHTIHFYCLQDDSDKGLGEDFLRACGAQQVLHETSAQLANANISGPLIFDLYLDLFNHSNDLVAEGDLWTDAEIDAFLKEVGPLVAAAELVTVSMSFNYSGTPEDTRYLTRRVMPKLLALRGDA
jgi:hypothetical protein